MSAIIYATLALCAIGAVCAVILILAAKYLNEPVDEKLLRVRECLPGANCGACGYAGCDGYAEALVSGAEERTNLCIPGADKVSHDISVMFGVEFTDVVEHVAFVRCMGDCEMAKQKYEYEGVQSCRAAKLLYGGRWACSLGCFGYGDCSKVCPNDAVFVENGVAKVDTKKCSGCGLCAKSCPNDLITIFPDVSHVVVTCSNTERGAVARGKCENACIACKKCERVCPSDAIKVTDNLAHIDYDKCSNCKECAKTCPVGCIKISDYSGIHRYIVK